MTLPSEPVASACSSTRSRISATVDSTKFAGVQLGSIPAMPVTKLRRTARPRGVWTTSGWNWIPYRLRAGASRPANGVDSVCAVAWNPSGMRVIESPWLIQTGWSRSMPHEQRVVPGDLDCRRAVLAARGRGDVAAQLQGHQLGAVADAQHREPAAPDRCVGLGGVGVVDGHRPAREDDGPDAAALELVHRRVVGQELGVDVELTHPARDQLRELAAEVQHGDRSGGGGRGRDRRAILRCALGGGRVERDLEIGLDLCIVGGQHPVARVRGLAVDGLAALPGLVRLGPGRGLLLLRRIGQ